MTVLIITGLCVLALWAVVARRLDEWQIAGPLVVVGAGVILGYSAGHDLNATLNSTIAERVVELILAILLFVDATEVRGGLFGGEAKIVARLLFLALPLSIVAAIGLGVVLLPSVSIALLVVIACVVIPTDFAPASAILRTAGIPSRIRHILNVESGYNDGIVSPVFLTALALCDHPKAHESTTETLVTASVASLVAIGVGVVIGLTLGLIVRRATVMDLMTPQSMRIATVAIPLLTYVVAGVAHGNGFVAAFVAGIVYRIARRMFGGGTALGHIEMATVDDVGVAMAMVMWFVFGVLVEDIFSIGFDWRFILYGFLALTVLRIVPVVLSLVGSSTSWLTRWRLGLLGPRGTASIVFGLLAFNELDDIRGNAVLYVMTVVVLGSIIIHGAIVPRIDRARFATLGAEV